MTTHLLQRMAPSTASCTVKKKKKNTLVVELEILRRRRLSSAFLPRLLLAHYPPSSPAHLLPSPQAPFSVVPSVSRPPAPAVWAHLSCLALSTASGRILPVAS
mmetsp:Transcript_11109/g.45008  ORF Transcript_11109/g.45008 Transcript_11109/m.45008 type:complete len:103 (+) Transcript_11109:1069-1377(+)